MATSASLNVLAVGSPSPAVRTSVSDHYALRVITSVTNEFWFLGAMADAHKVLAVHPGADIRRAAISKLPDFTEDGGFLSGSLSDGPGAYSIADIAHDGSDALSERFSNRQVIKGSVLVLYQASEDQDFTEDTRIRTDIGDKVNDDEGELIISFKSVISLIKGKLFSPTVLKLAEGLSDAEDEDVITVQRPASSVVGSDITLPRFQHDDSYSTDPGELICYWLTSENEVISTVSEKATNVNGTTLRFNIRQRGVFGSTIAPIAVDAGTEYDNLPELKELFFLEENFSDLLLLTLTGQTADGRLAPANSNYSLNLGLSRMYLPSLEYADGVLERQHFKGIKEQEARTFVEKRLLGEVFGTLLDNAYGQFDYRARSSFSSDATSQITLDENNIDLETSLVFEELPDRLRRFIFVKHGYNALTDTYELADIKISTDTLPSGVYGELEDIDYEYQGWNSAVGTISQLQLRVAVIQDLHHSLMVKTAIDLMPHMNHVRVGDVVTLDLRRIATVYNSKTGEPVALPPYLSMLVVARSGNSGDKNIRVALVASTGNVERSASDDNEATIDPIEYDRYAPTALSSIVTPEMRNGREVYSGTHVVPPNRIYRIDNPAILAVDFQLKPTHKGHYIGIAHREELSVLSTIGAIYGVGMGLYEGTHGPEGTPGYIGNTTSDGGVRLESYAGQDTNNQTLGRVTMVSLPSPTPARATLNTFTGFPMLNVGGRLTGIPGQLSGSGGQGGGKVSVVHRGERNTAHTRGLDAEVAAAPPGARGGDGGLSAIFFGKKLSWATSAILADVSGTDGSPGSVVLDTMSGSGAGGSAGVVSILVDGNHTVQLIKAANVKAYNGEPTHVQAHASRVSQRRQLRQSWYQGTPKVNRFLSHTAVTYLPSSANLSDRPLNAFDQLAEEEAGLDGKIVLHLIADTAEPQFPGNADVNDIAVYEVDARNQELGVTSTRAYRLTDAGWVRIEFPDIVAEFKITSFRDRGSTVLWVRQTRPPTGVYAVGDTWYNPSSRRMYVLGATAAEDTLLDAESFGDQAGFNLLVDPTWVRYAAGEDTLAFHQRWDEPLRSESSAPVESTATPGQTSFSFITVTPSAMQYEEDGSAQWQASGTSLVSSPAGSTGDARAFFGADNGFIQADAPRKVWLYAKTSFGTSTVKVQAGGDDSGVGNPGIQLNGSVSSTDFTWVKLTGTFAGFAAQLQLRTQSVGLEVAGILLIDQNSDDTPLGAAGFNAGSGSTDIERPFWEAPTSSDRKLPLQTSAGRGPFQLLDNGEGNSLSWRVDFSGFTPNILVERFPWKAKPGVQYRATVTIKMTVSSGFSNRDQSGIGIQLEGYDDSNNRVFTSGLENASGEDWYSLDGTQYRDVVLILEVPKNVSRLAWGAMKVVVRGDAAGYAEINQCELVELPYLTDTFLAPELTFFGAFSGTSNFFARTQELTRFDLNIKRGMRVDTNLEGLAKCDFTNTEFTPGLAILGVTTSVDDYGNSVGNVIDHPNLLTHTTARASFDEKLGSNVGQNPPFISNTNTPFSSVRSFIATTDITSIIIRMRTSNGDSSGASDLILSNLKYSVLYGDSFDDGL